MATPTAFASNTSTPVVGTELFLSNVNQAGVYTLEIDLSNMVALDVVELRVYQMILTGGTARGKYIDIYQGAQPTDGLIVGTVPISNDLTDAQSLRFSLKQTLGTARAFAWKVLKHA